MYENSPLLFMKGGLFLFLHVVLSWIIVYLVSM